MTKEQEKQEFISEFVEKLEVKFSRFFSDYAGIVRHAENVAENYYAPDAPHWSIERNIQAAIVATEFWLKGRKQY